MAKKIFFKADKHLIDYLTLNDFERRQVASHKKYYSNKDGKQVSVDFESGIITLLDKKGNTINFANNFGKDQIDLFIKSN